MSSVLHELQRVFKLDLTSCEGCGGQVRVIACIKDPTVIGLSGRARPPRQASADLCSFYTPLIDAK